MNWRNRAACRDENPDLFFPTGAPGPVAVAWQVNAAIAVCLRCPVRAACLSYALETRQDAGIWGGLTEAELRAQIRRAGRAPTGPAEPGSAKCTAPAAKAG